MIVAYSDGEIKEKEVEFGMREMYSDTTELTAKMLNPLIEKIVVHEAVKDFDGTRNQKIEIFYRFVGKLIEMQAASGGCSPHERGVLSAKQPRQ